MSRRHVVAGLVVGVAAVILIAVALGGRHGRVANSSAPAAAPSTSALHHETFDYQPFPPGPCFELQPSGTFAMDQDGPIVLFGRVLVLTGSFEMCGIDVNTGATIWHIATGDGPGGFVEVAPNVIYYQDKDVAGRIDTQTGHILSKSTEEIPPERSTPYFDEMSRQVQDLQVGEVRASIEPRGDLVALQVSDGSGRWRLEDAAVGGIQQRGPWILVGEADTWFTTVIAIDSRRPVKPQLDDLARLLDARVERAS